MTSDFYIVVTLAYITEVIMVLVILLTIFASIAVFIPTSEYMKTRAATAAILFLILWGIGSLDNYLREYGSCLPGHPPYPEWTCKP